MKPSSEGRTTRETRVTDLTRSNVTETDQASLQNMITDDARSRLDSISKSYFDPSSILRPQTVDFESSLLKLSDNDERLRTKVAQALAY